MSRNIIDERNIINELYKENEKLKRANKALSNRCFALTSGTLCAFCELDCSRRLEEFRVVDNREEEKE